ncbi:MAG: ATP-grasp fold amidoligase family protein, partial [Sphingomicrobium sp.]
RAKALAAAMLGSKWIVPTLWTGGTLPVEPCWPLPFMVKARHGCGHFHAVRNAADYAIARTRARRWMRVTYGKWLDEWLYGRIEPGLLVEPLIGEGPNLPIDYKLFVFGGQVRLVQVHLGRGSSNHRWIVMDLDWRRVSSVSRDPDPDRPLSLDRMIRAAERLGQEFTFVRIDFYEVEGAPLFGEMTFYPGSGLERIDPPELDVEMGEWCTAAVVATAHGEQERMQAAA